ncbi:hypothetical protein GW626_05320 [Peribacillus muralis]|uniref:hypothetical protein n=1 Tax=Peribacillus muralis TaxID=264697 RepID=UPI001F4DE282|nr:hypothetical protein [Peribacillus muralis]MCK1992951.1 hypothetical protein [Peribacillus muralis]MCK2013506.1 hypothetical protein [Peribacillus muralis]
MSSIAEKAFHLEVQTLLSFHNCNEAMEHIASTVPSERFSCEINYDAKDNNGPHWFGYRCFVKDLQSDLSLYIHFGFIFLPSTKVGLMVELDRNNNLGTYKQVWDQINKSSLYDINKDESDYLKLFLPDDHLTQVMEETLPNAQTQIFQSFFISCCEAFLSAGRKEKQ